MHPASGKFWFSFVLNVVSVANGFRVFQKRNVYVYLVFLCVPGLFEIDFGATTAG